MSFKISDSMHDPSKRESDQKKSDKPAALRPILQKAVIPPTVAVVKPQVKKAVESKPPAVAKPVVTPKPNVERKKINWMPRILWAVSGAMLILMLLVVVQFFSASAKPAVNTAAESTQQPGSTIALPAYNPTDTDPVKRLAEPKTTIPERTNVEATTYVVQKLDSVFGIATKFKLKPESILWANYDTLQDDPQNIGVGITLNIPPIDGVYYQWKDGDTLDAVAGTYHVDPSVIVNWPGNHLDLVDPVINVGQYVMIPGGKGEFKQWVVPLPYAAKSGASKGVSNQCTIAPGYPYATGSFIWPTVTNYISGNDFWSGHLGIDIGANLGDAVFASDTGVVVYAGSMNGGYGNVIIIEHDWMNGSVWHTVYAHLSQIFVHCGQSVYQGNTIAASGTSGNSTGPHLHFEIRENGMFINPHQVLP